MNAIAPDFGVTSGAIASVLRRGGVQMRSTNETRILRKELKTAAIECEKDAIIQAYRLGATFRELCKQYNTSGYRISKILKERGLKPLQGAHRRFTDDEEREIAEAYGRRELTSKLAKQYGCSGQLIRRIARDHGKIINGRGNWFKEFTNNEINDVLTLRRDRFSVAVIASRTGLSGFQVDRIVREHELGRRWVVKREAGHELPHKPGDYVFEVMGDDDPFFPYMARANGYVQQHRLFMARSLNRPLRADETVHHINGVRDDNRIENLQLRQGRHGKGVVAQCLDCGSHNVGTTKIGEAE